MSPTGEEQVFDRCFDSKTPFPPFPICVPPPTRHPVVFSAVGAAVVPIVPSLLEGPCWTRWCSSSTALPVALVVPPNFVGCCRCLPSPHPSLSPFYVVMLVSGRVAHAGGGHCASVG
ncbi:hypothetical protein E2562_024858 [Oryza meyeriana var. granulata]|uniref:Uncharacterized protein n=1 Tax=Oryza meyeriana var. granulata TaxID=110450 RepID=A0A6G1CGR5_9ORYZ|nr:hypothetical protein E2562_024858 [Oryza meyeriana var. granulata]